MIKKEGAGEDLGKADREFSSQNISLQRANLGDIEELSELYLGLSSVSRRFFHPFPFSRTKLRVIFLMMIISGSLINLIKKTFPKLGFFVLVAREDNSRRINGFTYLCLIDRQEGGKLVANRGIVTRETIRARGLGTVLDSQLIKIARNIGISRFRVTVLEDNPGSLGLHRKMGYKITGSTLDPWNGTEDKAYVLELELF